VRHFIQYTRSGIPNLGDSSPRGMQGVGKRDVSCLDLEFSFFFKGNQPPIKIDCFELFLRAPEITEEQFTYLLKSLNPILTSNAATILLSTGGQKMKKVVNPSTRYIAQYKRQTEVK
jgi:hypothetical protein